MARLEDLLHHVDEPFRSNPKFARAMLLYTEAAALTATALVVLLAVTVTGHYTGWWLLVLAVPAAALVAAAVIGTQSSATTRTQFPDKAAWRDAERRAVAASFFPLLFHRAHHRGNG